jgi:hypothetical protein
MGNVSELLCLAQTDPKSTRASPLVPTTEGYGSQCE